jgi:ribosomal protein S18 acetylase RimI-like enzyme
MIVRKAKPEDFKKIQKLNKALFDQDFQFDKTLETNWPFAEGVKYLKESIESDRSITVVAEEAGSVVGYMIAAIQKTPSYLKQDIKIVELENTLIEAGFRGQGTGQKMFEMVENWAKEKDANLMTVETSAVNENAQKFYEKMGLRQEEIIYRKKI